MVRYNRRGSLDTSRVRDRRGGGGGRIAIGGGLGGIILLVAALALGLDPSVLLQADPGPGSGAPPADGGLEACQRGADIEQQRECRFVAYENSVQEFWAAEFSAQGGSYRPATLTVFTGGVSTGCGSASSAMGPFYCPADEGVYMDIGFFQVLEQQMGAQGGDLAEAYVVAHEIGHHVQHLTRQTERVRSREGAESDAVRLELQADCYAGLWAHHATRGDDPIITEIRPEDIAVAIDAAETVGDDYIQSRQQGNVTPETWTHGSSEQRRRWFLTGHEQGDVAACDTWAADGL